MFYTKTAAFRKVYLINFAAACGISMAPVGARAELFSGQDLSLGVAKTIGFVGGSSANTWNFAAKAVSKLETPLLVVEAAKNIENGEQPPSELAYLGGAYYGGKIATYALSPIVRKACSGSSVNKASLAGCVVTATAAAYSIATVADKTGKAAEKQWGKLEQRAFAAVESQASSDAHGKDNIDPIVGLTGSKTGYLSNLEDLLNGVENYRPPTTAYKDNDTVGFDDNFGGNSEELEKNSRLSYEWDEKSGKNIWKVDGKIVDSSNEVVQSFCADPSKNCPEPSTELESSQPVLDTELATNPAENPLSTPTKDGDKTLEDVAKAAESLEMPDLTEVNNYIEQGRSSDDLGDFTPSPTASSLGADADSDTIGGMQSLGGNQVVEPGNSIWHGEGGFQGEEYNDNGLNGKSNIKQFKLWDSDQLAPQTNSDIQQNEITERVIDEPVPRGSVYMPEDDYSSGDTYSSSSDSNFNRPTQTQSRNRAGSNYNNKPVVRRCQPGGIDVSTPFPVPGKC